MKKIFLMTILLFSCFSSNCTNYEDNIILSVLKHFSSKENITKDDIYVYSNWRYIAENIDNLQINFIEYISDTLDRKIVFIDHPSIVEDKIAIEIGYIDKFFNKTNQFYYLFRYESSTDKYQLVNVLNSISQEWNESLYNDIIQKMIKDNYKPEDTIYVKLFDDINLPSKIGKNVIINLSNKEKSDKWYKNYFSSENSESFFLNEILPILSKGNIQIEIRKKNIVDYDTKSKNPICFVVVKAWDKYDYKVKYSFRKNKYKIKKK
jgi:hypothetical protein